MGTLLLTEYTGKLIIDDNIEFFLFHKFDRQVYNLRQQMVDVKTLLKLTEEVNQNFSKKLKEREILTDKQLKKFNQGHDVILYRDEIKIIKYRQPM